MKVAVLGLWHLGSVTAACLAQAGHSVVGWDPDPAVVANLANGKAPLAEPGLDELWAKHLTTGHLMVTATLSDAIRSADVVWITFDTPVDDEDRANVEAVMAQLRRVWPLVGAGALVVSSSQLPVGSVARMEREFAGVSEGRQAGFVCIPENLRLGKAVDRFLSPDRVVVGARTDRDRAVAAALLAPVTDRVVWMSVESAEMTKHAINAFLATSVAFINEIASIGEAVGADAKEVERGLKSDQRIGPAAYLSPGAAFAGGTLARDLVLLEGTAERAGLSASLVSGVLQSNREHRGWIERTLSACLAPLRGRKVAVWGLTYKPGTDTLRRSTSIELCVALAKAGVDVHAYDPAVATLPDPLNQMISLAPSALTAAVSADAIVVATEWPAFRDVRVDDLGGHAGTRLVVDPGRFLAATLGADLRVRYLAVGTPQS